MSKTTTMTFEEFVETFRCTELEKARLWSRLCLLRLEKAIRAEATHGEQMRRIILETDDGQRIIFGKDDVFWQSMKGQSTCLTYEDFAKVLSEYREKTLKPTSSGKTE